MALQTAELESNEGRDEVTGFSNQEVTGDY